jgi:hypothetical protein
VERLGAKWEWQLLEKQFGICEPALDHTGRHQFSPMSKNGAGDFNDVAPIEICRKSKLNYPIAHRLNII